MEEKLRTQSINRLNVKDSIIKILEDNNIHTLGTLCGKSKTNLKKLDLTQSQINKVEIELKLMGLNLKSSL